MLADYHVHTAYSDDSVYPMEQAVMDAVALGLEEICFTDHVDYGIKKDWDDPLPLQYRRGDRGEPERVALLNVNYPQYVAEIMALQDRYRDRIRIRLGLEFGMQTHTISRYESLFHRYPFDFILLSVHQLENKTLWDQGFQQDRPQEEYVLRYYEELLALVEQYHNYSVLGHMDLITRYDPAGAYPFEKVKPILTQILKRAISDGKGLEINTSCYRYGLPDLTPSRDILSLYRQLGGRILTIGSDCHKHAHLGAYVRQIQPELAALGFRQICTYRAMEPSFHTLLLK